GGRVGGEEPALHFVHAMLPLSISNRRDLSLSLYWRSRRGLPTGPQLAATRRGTGPPQVLTKKIGAQGAVGCSRRVGSVRQAYQRPVWTARRMVQGGETLSLCARACGTSTGKVSLFPYGRPAIT